MILKVNSKKRMSTGHSLFCHLVKSLRFKWMAIKTVATTAKTITKMKPIFIDLPGKPPVFIPQIPAIKAGTEMIRWPNLNTSLSGLNYYPSCR